MADQTFTISIPCDDDGFVTLQCPFCNDRFKLTGEGFQREDLLCIFCAYCGLYGEANTFLTDEIIEQAHIIAGNYAKSILNDFMKDLEKSLKHSKHVSFKAGKKIKEEDEQVLFEREEMETLEPSCCATQVKVRSSAAIVGIYCPFCGVK